MISETIPAMKPSGALIGAEKRLVGAGVYRNFRATEFDRVKSIARCLCERNIPGDGCDRSDADVGRAQRHDERDRVIRSSVGVDEKGPGHAARITKVQWSTGRLECRNSGCSTRSSLSNYNSSA
jgi:hypothetical protein